MALITSRGALGGFCLALSVFISLLLSGCNSLLPTGEEDVITPWHDFDDAKKSFDQIIPYTTDMDTVRKLGFDPAKTPNVQILSPSQVVKIVLPPPIQDKIDIPQGIQDCMKAQERCVGYLMEPSQIDRKRVGNFMLDFLNFKRNTVTTGWQLGALIVVVDNLVVFKQMSGRPQIQETEVRKNPLGPFQSGAGSLKTLP